MLTRGSWIAPLLLVAALAPGCATEPETLDGALVARAAEAYDAYARGDCHRVLQLTDPTAVPIAAGGDELQYSMTLLHGFCLEREGDATAAEEVYRELVRYAPRSFAAADARERLRILRLQERDPAYQAWIEGAPNRYANDRTTRIAVDRTPAEFPPIAAAAGVEGYAVVEFGITPRGDTEAPVVVDSSPPLLFDGAALRAVREWRYLSDNRSPRDERQVIRIVFQVPAELPSEAGPADPTATP